MELLPEFLYLATAISVSLAERNPAFMSGRVSSGSHYPPKLACLADCSLKGLGEEEAAATG
jgi:hypothetical protein